MNIIKDRLDYETKRTKELNAIGAAFDIARLRLPMGVFFRVYADYLIATQENKETNKEIFEKIVEYGKFHL